MNTEWCATWRVSMTEDDGLTEAEVDEVAALRARVADLERERDELTDAGERVRQQWEGGRPLNWWFWRAALAEGGGDDK